MREILFRGYSKEDNQWHYGYYLEMEKGSEILDRHPGDGSIRGNIVDKDSIGQYTGFKDKNGKHICLDEDKYLNEIREIDKKLGYSGELEE